MDTGATNLMTLDPAADRGLVARLAAAIRHAGRRYCERIVDDVLPEAPLGGHDWFMDLTEAR